MLQRGWIEASAVGLSEATSPPPPPRPRSDLTGLKIVHA